MQPVAWCHTADADVAAAQNFLPNEGDHDGVINIVIGCVAACDIFKSKLRGEADDSGITGLQHPVCSFVHRPKFTDKCFYDDQRWIEHRISLRFLQKHY